MSDLCITDLCTISKQPLQNRSVDTVMAAALWLMTGKLFTIYAHNAFASHGEPNKMQCFSYLCGMDSIPPLDAYSFPRLFGDLSSLQSENLGRPMPGPSGMLLALVIMSASSEQVLELTDKLSRQQEIKTAKERRAALKAVYAGEGPE